MGVCEKVKEEEGCSDIYRPDIHRGPLEILESCLHPPAISQRLHARVD